MTSLPSQRPAGTRRATARLLAGGLAMAAALAIPSLITAGAAAAAPKGAPGGAISPTAGGTLRAWGFNAFGQLGNGTTTDSSAPVQPGLPVGTAVAGASAGCGHTLALTRTGLVYAWGSNDSGQLGNDTTTSSPVPVRVLLPVGTTATAVAAGCQFSLALTSTGQVLAWGRGSEGQLGNGATASRATPVPVTLPAGTAATAVSAGGDHALALTSTGGVLAWGLNDHGQLGDGTSLTRDVPVPVSMPPGVTVTAVGAGAFHSLALTRSGQVLAWGQNASGELGDGTSIDRATPVAVALPAGTTVTAVSAGAAHSLALTSTGSVLAWGANDHGQLGNGTTSDSPAPVAVALPPGVAAAAVSAGADHSLALTAGSQVWAWGANGDGELGDGTTTDSAVPVRSFPQAALAPIAIASGPGAEHSLAIVLSQIR
jgi:alpha-tubulin suppressor-like RCC1 family protein